jgi:Family of unknown function (DUF6988)
MTTSIKHCVERATYYREEILQEVGKSKTADNSDRSRVATAFISMAAGDFEAILTEIGNNNRGPALKLFRFLHEDVINALWVQAFASDELVGKLLHGTDGQVPGTMAERAAQLDTIFVPPPTVQPAETLFVDIHGKLWKAACSYAHGGSLAINRELAGYDDASMYEVLRTSTNLFVMLMNGMYELHHDSKQNGVLRSLANSFFVEKW